MGTDHLASRIRAGIPRLREWMSRPVDPTPLVVFRVGFGLLMLGAAVRFLSKGWVETQYIQPEFHFRYYLFQWVPALPGDWLYLVFATQIVCAALIAIGWHYRAATIGFFLSFSYVELIDQTTYLNHYYFISLVAFLLIFLPLHRWTSLDARLNSGVGGGSAPRWIPLVFQAQIAIVYFFAGLAKLNPDWLFHAQPLSIWLAARSGFPVLGILFDQSWFAYLMSWAGAAFDLSIPFLLFWRRSRPWAYLGVIGFHLMTGALFPIGVFPWVMIFGTLIFFDTSDYIRMGTQLKAFIPRRLTEEPEVRRAPRGAASPVPIGRALPLILIPFFVLQLLMPLRHLAYPGDVLWTEEGYRFSWRVMVVEKTGTVFFTITDPATGRSWDEFPGDYLTSQQERQLAFQPDMILGFAHYLQDTLRSEGVQNPEIKARAYVSLNGRRNRPLVDPDLDLTQVPRSLSPKSWVLAQNRP